MKGAIGNAWILNIVITFILIFFVLLMGSISYSKAYRIKNYLIDSLTQYTEKNGPLPDGSEENRKEWNKIVNPGLANFGYNLSASNHTCPQTNKEFPNDKSYKLVRDTSIGSYEYCIYIKEYNLTYAEKQYINKKYNYMVLSYMRMDLPVIQRILKLRLTGETKTFTQYK